MDEPHAGLPRSLRRLLRFAERHGHRPLGHDHLGRTVAAARTPKRLPAATRLTVAPRGRAGEAPVPGAPLPPVSVQRGVTRAPPPAPVVVPEPTPVPPSPVGSGPVAAR